jgi:acetyl esterase/lipase
MTHALDPQLLEEITAALASGAMTLPQPASRDDWKTLRASGEAALAAMEATLPEHPSVSRAAYTATSHDGASVALRWYAPDPALVPFAGWSYDDNYTGWHALLGENIGTEGVPASAAPARAVDLAGLPPAYMEVGELDIFRNEDIEYARRVAAAGTSVELYVHPGCPMDSTAPPGARTWSGAPAPTGCAPSGATERRGQHDARRRPRSFP